MAPAPSVMAQRHRGPTLRVVMTGAGGFLGAHLLARFVGAGMAVTVVGPDTGESRYTARMVAAGGGGVVPGGARVSPPRGGGGGGGGGAPPRSGFCGDPASSPAPSPTPGIDPTHFPPPRP